MSNQTSAPTGAWKCNFPSFWENDDIPTTKRLTIHRPTDGHEGSGREVILQQMNSLSEFGVVVSKVVGTYQKWGGYWSFNF